MIPEGWKVGPQKNLDDRLTRRTRWEIAVSAVRKGVLDTVCGFIGAQLAVGDSFIEVKGAMSLTQHGLSRTLLADSGRGAHLRRAESRRRFEILREINDHVNEVRDPWTSLFNHLTLARNSVAMSGMHP